MLRTRVVTALLLFFLFFSALFFFPPTAWVIFSSLIAVIGAWEWGGLMGLAQRQRLLLGCLFAVFCGSVALLYPDALGLGDFSMAAAWALGRWFYVPATVFWLLLVPLWLRFRWRLPKFPGGLLVGSGVILPAWLALLQLKLAGAPVLLAVMAAIWLADIAAYFCGHALGRHKLAPAISPGKTWEGAFGGVVAVILYGLLFFSRFPETLKDKPLLLLFALALLAAMSILGDLFESLLKRQRALKDSSGILPGHGGVLDRIDSLTSTLPLVALFWLITVE